MSAPMDGGASALGQLRPSRFLTFLLPNPHPTTTSSSSPYASHLRIAVLDSPIPTPPPPKTAAMLVPPGRESDWIFSTAEGQLQLLLAPSALALSRLLLVGNAPVPPSDLSSPPVYTRQGKGHRLDTEQLETRLLPFLLALCPKPAFDDGIPTVPFLSYEDDVVRSVPVERAVGPVAGEMLVEEIEIGGYDDGDDDPREVRRRLRFRRMPNLVQTQVRIMPRGSDDLLVQPYLRPMVAGICLIAAALEEKARSGSRPRVICLGVGGGSLLMCLKSELGFDVVGVEADEVVLDVAKRHFGLEEDEFLRVCVGDGVKIMESFAENGADSCWGDCVGGVDVVMVDLDSGDAATGLTAPPVEFIRRNVVAGARMALQEKGVLVINVVPLNGSVYIELIGLLRQVFSKLYEIGVGNGENYVVVATASPVECVHEEDWNSPLKKKLKEIVGQRYIDCIRKI